MDVRVVVMHTLKAMLTPIAFIFLLLSGLFSVPAHATSDIETKKTYIEDIFIWRMSDELKLSANEEKKFTEIHKRLNKKKAELNKNIQETTQNLAEEDHSSEKMLETNLKKLRKDIKEYNQISLDEFDSMMKLLGSKRFSSYLQIKSDLTNKVKSLLSGEKAIDKINDVKDKKEVANPKLHPPQVILEKNE